MNSQAASPESPVSSDNQSISYYQARRAEALNRLYILSGDISSTNEGVSNAIYALTTTLEHWLLGPYKELVRTTDDDDLEFHEKIITNTLRVMNFVVSVSEQQLQVEVWDKVIQKMEGSRD